MAIVRGCWSSSKAGLIAGAVAFISGFVMKEMRNENRSRDRNQSLVRCDRGPDEPPHLPQSRALRRAACNQPSRISYAGRTGAVGEGQAAHSLSLDREKAVSFQQATRHGADIDRFQ